MAIYNPMPPDAAPVPREKLIRAVGVIVLLGTTAWLLANWGSLPVRLPSHYGFGGEIDGWSGARLPGTAPGHRLGRVAAARCHPVFPPGLELQRPAGHRPHPSHALLSDGRDAHRAAAGHCPDLCLPQCLASHLPALAGWWWLCPGQSVREPGLVSLAGSPAGTHPTQGVKPLHGNAVL